MSFNFCGIVNTVEMLQSFDELNFMSPFISNEDGDVSGAGEADVVDGVDQFWEQQSVYFTLCVKRPLKS